MDPMKIIENHWKKIPVPIFDIIQEIGLKFDFRPLDENISGWIERKSGGVYEIVVNNNHSENRRRFTAAHELAHYIYHRYLLGEGVSDSKAYRSLETKLHNRQITIAHERQANSFAANILMPSHALANINETENIALLAQKFIVSEQAMRIRLGRQTN